MSMNDLVLDPPFNVTRASHVVLNVTDLAASRAFYTDLVGLVVSDEDADAVYLRGLEEACHHSLILRKAPAPSCARVGLRTRTEDDLRAAKDYFDARGVAARFVEVPYQGLTLHVADAIGTPLELCATMELRPRLMSCYTAYHAGAAQRLDHFQIAAYDPGLAYGFYQPLGFRCSEYTYSRRADGGEDLWGVWLQRKGNPHDIVFTNGVGPRLHHFAYLIRDAHDLVHVCDVAGSLGLGQNLDRGPGRHGISGAVFVYFLDPDGHRIELFNTHYQHIDIEPAIGWELSDPRRADLWGMPATERWFTKATHFEGVEPRPPVLKAELPTLERFLQSRAAS
jgi:catechol 2,3-dioxygenase